MCDIVFDMLLMACFERNLVKQASCPFKATVATVGWTWGFATMPQAKCCSDH
jgi:hypothetical protein